MCERFTGEDAPDWMTDRAKDEVIAAARALGSLRTTRLLQALNELDRLQAFGSEAERGSIGNE